MSNGPLTLFLPKEYSFFPFENATIANASPEGEREAIIGYKDNQEIQNKICEF